MNQKERKTSTSKGKIVGEEHDTSRPIRILHPSDHRVCFEDIHMLQVGIEFFLEISAKPIEKD